MSSDDPIESATSGAVKGLLEWSSQKIAELTKRFKNKELAFIQEKTTIDIVREQYASGESKFYSKYIKDKEMLLLIRLGLTLRRLESNQEKLTNLKQKIMRKYEAKGLHVSYFVQNGILNRYIGILLEEISSIEELENKIMNILINIEKHAVFVSWQDSSRNIIQRSLTITASHSPSIFILSGIGLASKIVRECASNLESLLNNYDLERFSSGDKEVLFFKRRLIQ